MHQSDSIPIVAAGPISNLILYILALTVGIWVDHQYLDHFAYVNLFLFIFNILPLYPMDGGQIMRDLLMTKGKKIIPIYFADVPNAAKKATPNQLFF